MDNKNIKRIALLGILIAAALVLDLALSPNLGAPLIMAAAVGIASIDDVSDRETHGSAIAYDVYLMSVSQLDRTRDFPQPVAGDDGVRTVPDTIPALDSEKPFYISAHDIPTLVSTTEKGDITTTGENTMVIIAGGDRAPLRDFVDYHQGGKFIIFYKHVREKQWMILGETERPMLLSTTETKDDKDGRYTTLTFKRSSTDLPYAFAGDPRNLGGGA